MTQEDKDLLLKDLCARLPYGVNIQVYYEDIAGYGYFDETVWVVDNDEPFHINDRWIENIKPYLRPMSSMTEEEKKERNKFVKSMADSESYTHYIVFPHDSTYYTDWLNANHFDYRGLIGKGLAIQAPDGMYN